MYVDGLLSLTLPTISNNTRIASSGANILDAGSSRHEFGARAKPLWMHYKGTFTSNDNVTVMIDFVASDESDLDVDFSAGTTEVLASTGIMATDGTDLWTTTTGLIEGAVPLISQKIARRYYGAHVTLGGTNPGLAAAAGSIRIVQDAQTNMPGAKA